MLAVLLVVWFTPYLLSILEDSFGTRVTSVTSRSSKILLEGNNNKCEAGSFVFPTAAERMRVYVHMYDRCEDLGYCCTREAVFFCGLLFFATRAIGWSWKKNLARLDDP